jgi:hypothetical protein
MAHPRPHGFAQMFERESLGCAKGNFRQALLLLSGRREPNRRQQRHVMIRFFFKGRRELKSGEKCCCRAAYLRMKLSEWDQKLTAGQWNDGHYYLPKKFGRDRSLAGRNSLGLSLSSNRVQQHVRRIPLGESFGG